MVSVLQATCDQNKENMTQVVFLNLWESRATTMYPQCNLPAIRGTKMLPDLVRLLLHWNWLFLRSMYFIYLEDRLIEREKWNEKETFNSLFHSPKWLWRLGVNKPNFGTLSTFSTWMAEAHTLGPSAIVFPDALSRNWMHSSRNSNQHSDIGVLVI